MKKKINKYHIFSFAIVGLCIFLSASVIITGMNDYQKLLKSQSALENYKNAPRNLLDPDVNPGSSAYAPMSKLVIPKIGVDVWIRSDTVNAYDSVYIYPESVPPGKNGDCGLLGHRTTYSGPFKKLGSLKVGDKVIIEDLLLSKKYVYQVTSNGNDIRWDYKTNPIKFAQDGEARLMLITCYPPGKKQAAYITHCKLVSVSDLK